MQAKLLVGSPTCVYNIYPSLCIIIKNISFYIDKEYILLILLEESKPCFRAQARWSAIIVGTPLPLLFFGSGCGIGTTRFGSGGDSTSCVITIGGCGVASIMAVLEVEREREREREGKRES